MRNCNGCGVYLRPVFDASCIAARHAYMRADGAWLRVALMLSWECVSFVNKTFGIHTLTGHDKVCV